ncbi:MAG: hypothetical protein KJ697_03480 [Nanoarchaeota archaeon]|nr:hypothetical protein [Nanoarchaeota archaeon]MBU4124165.1 hypothetical protein [Nanoarchaeota archaeon]
MKIDNRVLLILIIILIFVKIIEISITGYIIQGTVGVNVVAPAIECITNADCSSNYICDESKCIYVVPAVEAPSTPLNDPSKGIIPEKPREKIKAPEKPIPLFDIRGNIVIVDKPDFTIPTALRYTRPGGVIVVNVELFNFGNKTDDVIVIYNVYDSSNISILEIQETVAVETSLSFIRYIKIPENTLHGEYVLQVELKYINQRSPAVSRNSFMIGIFCLTCLSIDYYLFLVILITIGIVAIYYLRKISRVPKSFDYSAVAKKDRDYYEIIGDMIFIMRTHVGDKIIKEANKINGLKVADTGKVLKIGKYPAEILAILVNRYEMLGGKNNIRRIIEKRKLDDKKKKRKISEAIAYIKIMESLKHKK